ncbi:hypothetical protein KEF29_04855 [Streptomyces tuirus]|uniref:Uncharacterized protein n=1 Tax=Streptomyces tuirus TaxID=68278 RepID=A0A941F989_9ACTN|nr:hypothetical protein [Streptomyces tuirus]
MVLASAVAVGVTSLESALLLALLFLALLVPRAARLPALLDLLVCAALTWATWSQVWHWYRVVGWYDTVVHFVTPGRSLLPCTCCSPVSGCCPHPMTCACVVPPSP